MHANKAVEMAENEYQNHGIEELKEMVECCICAKTFNDPRLLPCAHSFCLRCLQETGSKTGKEIGDKMACPLCTVEFIIPPNGLPGLQKNFFVEKLMNLPGLKSLTPIAKRINCDVCLGDRVPDAETEVSAAEIFCEDCPQSLCEGCFKQHNRFQGTMSHKVTTIGNGDNSEMLSEAQNQISCIHRGRVNLNIFCSDCKTVVCALCFVETHQIHKGADATKIADDFRKAMKETAEELNKRLSEVEEKKSSLDHNKDEFLKAVEDLEKDVRERYEELKIFGEKQMQELLSELKNMQLERLKETENMNHLLDQHGEDLESLKTHCNQLSNNASVKNVCQGMHVLTKKVDELKVVHQQRMQQKIDPFQTTLKKTEFGTSVNKNILGCFETKGKF